MPKKKKTISGKLIIGILVLAIIGTIIILAALSNNHKSFLGSDVATIYITGPISVGASEGILSSEGTSSTEIIRFIDEADKDQNIKAIIFEINSPGGTAVASKEIADRIKKVKKLKIAVIREAGVSGAYWVASACDKIVANDLSIVGSIGVISSYLEFSGLFDKYNITYQRMISGKYKDIGSPFKQLTNDEEQKLQGQLDSIHNYFVSEVAKNRGIDKTKAAELATGEFFIGFDALELGLVDILGDKDTAKTILEQELNTTKINFIEYKRRTSILDVFSSIMSKQSFFVGKGVGSEMFKISKNNRIEILT
ncbi:MAG: signal peptide peptidase SppA [Nanoarchaeota archaeon]|nr:signal peptide peptidase SppA [Nanoarchaeota archaeon]